MFWEQLQLMTYYLDNGQMEVGEQDWFGTGGAEWNVGKVTNQYGKGNNLECQMEKNFLTDFWRWMNTNFLICYEQAERD